MARLLDLQQKAGRAPLIAEVSMPLLFLLALILIDHAIPGSSVAVVLESFNPALYDFTNSWNLRYPVEVAHYTRTAAFVTLAIFCVLFSVILQRFRSAHDEMLEIITRFSKPLLLCDLSGRILYSNGASKERFHLQAQDPQPILVSDIFAPPANKGVFISDYINAFEQLGITSTGEPRGTITMHFEGMQLLGEPISLTSTGNKNIILSISE